MKDPTAVSELMLERYRLGELSAEETDALREALQANSPLRDRLAALAGSDQQILAARPPAQFAASVEQRLRAERAQDRGAPPRFGMLAPVWGLSLVLAVSGALLLRGAWPGSPGSAQTARSGDRPKGGSPSLLLFRQAPDRTIERLEPGSSAHARELLQLAYQAGGRRYGVILSIDGRGVVTQHLPATGDQAAPLKPSGPAVLPSAYRLDDAPRLERFYFVAADEPFAVPPVMAAARSAALDPLNVTRLPLEPPFAQASFLLRKE